MEAKPLTDLLDSLGGWPVLGNNTGGNWKPNAFDFEKLWADIRKYGVDVIIATGVQVDSANNSKYRLKVHIVRKNSKYMYYSKSLPFRL